MELNGKLPAILSKQDFTYLEGKQKEICEYFQLRMLLCAEDEIDFKKYAALWNWSILIFKNLLLLFYVYFSYGHQYKLHPLQPYHLTLYPHLVSLIVLIYAT